MRITYREHWLLRRMDGGLRRSDPHLAVMLAIFARLNAGEVITSGEQGPPGTCIRHGLTWLRSAVAGVVACLTACGRRVFRRAASACAAVRWRFAGSARATRSASSAARSPTRRGHPGLSRGW